MEETIIGIDLGATHIRAARVRHDAIGEILSQRIRSGGTEEEVLEDVFAITDQLMNEDVRAIGIGVPGVVDVEAGMVYDAVYIPSWKRVPLQKYMEERYGVPVYVNNDANCFALGEYYYGKGKGCDAMIGLTVGTGVGAGIIINQKLCAGVNCGAGEFGSVEYLDQTYEYYCSGSFFRNVHGVEGEVVYRRALAGDAVALGLYEEMGGHLGNCIKMIVYTYDPRLIVLGGSVRHAYKYFETAMWRQVRTCLFQHSVERLRIEVSALPNSGILGAAALYYDAGR